MLVFFELLLNAGTWIILLASLVFVVGIVWRVEAELDIAYKCFSLAVVLFLVREILGVLPLVRQSVMGDLLVSGVHFLAALMLFLGMYFMRDLIRRMDGEKSMR